MNKKALIFLSLLLSTFIFLSGCGSNEGSGTSAEGSSNSNEVKTIKMAHWYGQDHWVNVALEEKFKPMIEENSEGKLKVEIYPASQLGAEEQMYQGVQSGSIEMVTIGVGMENQVPKVGLFSLPYLYQDFDHAEKVLNGEIGEDISAQLEENTG